jgi:hypothetical protein
VSKAAEDLNAPIVYGTNRQVQDAAAYVRDPTSASLPTAEQAEFNTSYINEKGESVRLGVVIYSAPVADGFVLNLSTTSETTIGISGIAQNLSEEQIVIATKQVAAQNGSLQRASLRGFLGPQSEKFVGEVYPNTDIKAKLDDDYLFFTGTGKFFIRLASSKLADQTTSVIVLDKARAPLFASAVELVAPAK